MNKELELAASECKSPVELRDKILALEACMMEMKGAQVNLEPVHHFAPGVYMRELTVPKGTTVVGKIHKTEHLSIISKGDCSVLTDQGVKRLKASTVIHSLPGIKRVVYAHEDTVFITVHPSNERDLVKLEEQLIARSFEEALPLIEKPMIESKGV